MSFRARAIMAALSAACLVTAACSGGKGGPSHGVSVTQPVKGGHIEAGVIPAKGTPSYNFLRTLANGLEKDYPGTKMTLTFANTEARPGLEQRWRSGKGPDLDYGMFDGTNPNLQDWANDDFLVDLTPYLKQQDPQTGKPWLDSFSTTAQPFMKNKDGKYYAVPTEASLTVLFYNAKIFKDNNIKPPTTWDELLTAADKLKAAGVDPIAITGLFEPYMGMWSDYLFLRTVGYAKTRAALSDCTGKLDDPGFADGLTKLQQLRDKGAFLKGFQGTDFTAAQAAFFQGKAGMILMGSWLVSEMKKSIPANFDLGAIGFPTVPGGHGDQTALMGGEQLVSVNAKSNVIPLAVEWLKRLTSRQTQTARAKEIGEVSARNDVIAPPEMPGMDKVMKSASTMVPRYYGIPDSKTKDAVYPEIAKLLFGKSDAQQTLNNLKSNLSRVCGN